MEVAVTVNMTLFETALYYAGKIVGVVPFVKRNNKIYPANLLGKCYAILILGIQIFLCIFILRNIPRQGTDFLFSTLIDSATIVAVIGSIVAATLLFAFNSEKIIGFINEMKLIDVEIESLKIGTDSRVKISKHFYTKIIVTNLGIVMIEIVSNQTVYSLQGVLGYKILFIGGIIITQMTIHNTLLIFDETMNCITRRFEFLNQKLQNIFLKDSETVYQPVYRTSDIFLTPKNEQITIGNNDGGKSSATADPEFDNIQLYKKRIKLILKIHQKLSNLVESTIDLYEIPIVLRSLQHIIRVCRNFRTIALLLKGPITTTTYVRIIQKLTASCIVFLVELFMTINSCASTCEMRNKTNIVMYDVWCNFRRDARKLKAEFLMFSTTLLQKPLVISAFGFITLNYSIIFEIFCALIGYAILIVQMDL